MSPIDTLALANKKNLIDKSKLVSELHRISKEERTDMRLLNNAKQRLKSRYCKLDAIVADNKGSDPSDVVMYETHNPGFCYRRNGECRTTQSPIKNTSLAFNDIHGMVFSDDEVDIDKILCLHLLSAHSTETLTPPPKSQRTGVMIQRDQSPLERLIERSKKRHVEDKMIKLLPVHILNVNKGKAAENLMTDGRLAARLIINEKINQLIKSVMVALENSNADKLKELIAKAHNDVYLGDMICHPDMQDFINSLNGFNVVSCCESFHMTPPFKYVPKEIFVKTSSGYLESLVSQIRKNIFKLPINCCWETAGNNFFQLYYNPLECPKRTENFDGKEREIFSERLDSDSKRQKRDSSASEKESSTTSGTSSSLGEKTKTTLTSNPSTHQLPKVTNVEVQGSKVRESPYKNPGTYTNMNLDQVADFITKKANSAIQKDLKTLQLAYAETPGCSTSVKVDMSTSTGVENRKYSLKQTTCPACSEKWKIPLPPPKTSVIKRNVLNQNQDAGAGPKDSSHNLSVALDRELKFWNEYRTKSSKSITSASMKFTPRRFYRSNVIEIIDLDELDLAKIRQEIREHETQKKLNQFLTH